MKRRNDFNSTTMQVKKRSKYKANTLRFSKLLAISALARARCVDIYESNEEERREKVHGDNRRPRD